MSDEPDELNAFYWAEQFDLCYEYETGIDVVRHESVVERLQAVLDRLKKVV